MRFLQGQAQPISRKMIVHFQRRMQPFNSHDMMAKRQKRKIATFWSV